MVLYKIGREDQFSFYLCKRNATNTHSLTGSDTNFLLAWDLLTINSVGF